MPTATVPNEHFREHKNVDIYHVFRNDDEGQGRRAFWYTTDEYGSENDETAFDVRTLHKKLAEGGRAASLNSDKAEDHEKIIAAALDAGFIIPK